MTRMSRADRRVWAAARSLADLGNLTALWLEGELGSQPGYAAGYGPDEETLPLVPVLARLNRAGIVTSGSQPGFDGEGAGGAHWKQRAAVEAYAAESVALPLIHSAGVAGLRTVACPPSRVPRWRYRYDRSVAVTRTDGCDYTWFGTVVPRRHIRDAHIGYGTCHRAAVKALCGAWQVTVYDPEWGRESLLWDVLDAALSAGMPGRPTGSGARVTAWSFNTPASSPRPAGPGRTP